MKAKYDLKKNPKRNDDDTDETLHPRLVSSGTISSRELFEETAQFSSLTAAELEAALTTLADRAGWFISQGYTVEFGKMGNFSGSLKALHKIYDKKDIRSMSVVFNGVNFRASKWFCKQSAGSVERAKRGFKSSTDIGREKRIARLMDHLDKYLWITRKEYCAITGLLKTKALKELHELEKEGIVESRGKGNQLAFMKKSNK